MTGLTAVTGVWSAGRARARTRGTESPRICSPGPHLLFSSNTAWHSETEAGSTVLTLVCRPEGKRQGLRGQRLAAQEHRGQTQQTRPLPCPRADQASEQGREGPRSLGGPCARLDPVLRGHTDDFPTPVLLCTERPLANPTPWKKERKSKALTATSTRKAPGSPSAPHSGPLRTGTRPYSETNFVFP